MLAKRALLFHHKRHWLGLVYVKRGNAGRTHTYAVAAEQQQRVVRADTACAPFAARGLH